MFLFFFICGNATFISFHISIYKALAIKILHVPKDFFIYLFRDCYYDWHMHSESKLPKRKVKLLMLQSRLLRCINVTTLICGIHRSSNQGFKCFYTKLGIRFLDEATFTDYTDSKLIGNSIAL